VKNGWQSTLSQEIVKDLKRLLSSVQTPVLTRIQPPFFYGNTSDNIYEWLKSYAFNLFIQKETKTENKPLDSGDWKTELQQAFPVAREAALREIELDHRVQYPNENASECAVQISCLVKAAYPGLDSANGEIISEGAFFRGIKPII